MMLAVRESGLTSRIARIRVRDGSGLSVVGTVKARDASGLSTVFSSMAASASAPDTGYANSGSPADVTTGFSTVTVSGGVAPYTYLWSQVGSSSAVWTIGSPTNNFSSFTALAIDPVNGDSAIFKCTVTDSTGESVESNQITANVVNLGGG